MSNNPVKWSARSNVVTACPSAGGMINLAATSNALGAEIDNTAGDQWGDFQCKCRGQDVFHAGDWIGVWFIAAADGTNYEDGAVGAGLCPLRQPDIIFVVQLNNTQNIITIQHVLLPNCKFKCLVRNVTNHTLTNTADENVITYYSYNDNIVGA